ncbi:protein FAR1-RELATED SEQUENCE 5 [Striga asiatica]|uniref:Protein FAR1-RELATED SEQUENCE 5 n=1 Tax=Striga asiatica TaxID=4170 RepID=A0A5A7PJ79_STRAF|nr:protein FAR1-RELATED SEQUENCE 5 [Striga asiatica]
MRLTSNDRMRDDEQETMERSVRLYNGESWMWRVGFQQYAAECGFDIRRSTKKKSSDGFLIRSYIVCSREGEKNYSRDYTDGDSGSIKKRRRVSKRINCEAKLITKFAGQKGALDAQRHVQDQMNMGNESYAHQFKTPLLIERHAGEVYTSTIFGHVQNDIVAACFNCRVCSVVVGERTSVYEIDDGLSGTSKVVYERDENTTTFSRWTKLASLNPIFIVDGEVIWS